MVNDELRCRKDCSAAGRTTEENEMSRPRGTGHGRRGAAIPRAPRGSLRQWPPDGARGVASGRGRETSLGPRRCASIVCRLRNRTVLCSKLAFGRFQKMVGLYVKSTEQSQTHIVHDGGRFESLLRFGHVSALTSIISVPSQSRCRRYSRYGMPTVERASAWPACCWICLPSPPTSPTASS